MPAQSFEGALRVVCAFIGVSVCACILLEEKWAKRFNFSNKIKPIVKRNKKETPSAEGTSN